MLRRILPTIISVTYPFAVLFGLLYLGLGFLCVGILLLAAIHCALQRSKTSLALFAATVILVIIAWTQKDNFALKLYPVAVNAITLIIFAGSLCSDQSIIERFARLKDPNLPAKAILYTRRITMIWCIFFIINGAVALWTATSTSDEVWAFYNGFIAYILIAMLLIGEWLVRKRILKGNQP